MGGETVEEVVGGTNFEGGLGSALKVESMVADEGASVVGGLGVEPVDSLLCCGNTMP